MQKVSKEWQEEWKEERERDKMSLLSAFLLSSPEIEIKSKKEEKPLENLFPGCKPGDRLHMHRMSGKQKRTE